jgi:hypothetical protein
MVLKVGRFFTHYRLLYFWNCPNQKNNDVGLALGKNGKLDNDKAIFFIWTFCPDRDDGAVRMADFVCSIDSVYKEVTVASSSKIDKALKNILNVTFMWSWFV